MTLHSCQCTFALLAKAKSVTHVRNELSPISREGHSLCVCDYIGRLQSVYSLCSGRVLFHPVDDSIRKWCADFKGESSSAMGYCYPLTVSDQASLSWPARPVESGSAGCLAGAEKHYQLRSRWAHKRCCMDAEGG
jgi:hypothetical protein